MHELYLQVCPIFANRPIYFNHNLTSFYSQSLLIRAISSTLIFDIAASTDTLVGNVIHTLMLPQFFNCGFFLLVAIVCTIILPILDLCQMDSHLSKREKFAADRSTHLRYKKFVIIIKG